MIYISFFYGYIIFANNKFMHPYFHVKSYCFGCMSKEMICRISIPNEMKKRNIKEEFFNVDVTNYPRICLSSKRYKLENKQG